VPAILRSKGVVVKVHKFAAWRAWRLFQSATLGYLAKIPVSRTDTVQGLWKGIAIAEFVTHY
jgi:hypothetical protein